jgi:phage-related protein
MRSEKWVVEFYRKANGRCPTEEFLDSLTSDEKVFVKRAIQRLEEFGLQLQRPHAAPLRDHILELRKRTHQGNIRLLYFFFDGEKFIITHGFKKKTSAVPADEINKAIEFRKDYLNRVKRKS